jgi:hypothetical protein
VGTDPVAFVKDRKASIAGRNRHDDGCCGASKAGQVASESSGTSDRQEYAARNKLLALTVMHDADGLGPIHNTALHCDGNVTPVVSPEMQVTLTIGKTTKA